MLYFVGVTLPQLKTIWPLIGYGAFRAWSGDLRIWSFDLKMKSLVTLKYRNFCEPNTTFCITLFMSIISPNVTILWPCDIDGYPFSSEYSSLIAIHFLHFCSRPNFEVRMSRKLKNIPCLSVMYCDHITLSSFDANKPSLLAYWLWGLTMVPPNSTRGLPTLLQLSTSVNICVQLKLCTTIRSWVKSYFVFEIDVASWPWTLTILVLCKWHLCGSVFSTKCEDCMIVRSLVTVGLYYSAFLVLLY